MLVFDDFEQAHRELLCSYMRGELNFDLNKGLMVPLMIKVNFPVYPRFDYSNFGYGTKKANMLLGKYFDEDKWNEFQEYVKLKKDYVYSFESKKVYAGRKKPNCMVCVIYNSTTDCYTVVWRSAEFCCRLAADLKFLSTILDKPVYMMFCKGNVLTEALYPVFKMNEWSFPKKNENLILESLLQFKKKYFSENSEESTWQPIALVQRQYFKKFFQK